jgi:short-subunit dehydrogenase
MVDQKIEGTLVAVTSVAGDRGRASNYPYGSAKAGLSAYCSGLGQALARKGVTVIDIRPGFVATKMTKHLKQGPLFASPEAIAKGIIKAVRKGSPVVYLPWFWRFIMAAIVHIPSRVFRKFSL